ncbi:hypothetical protein LBW12_02565 [Latilactobacillus curvatus]|uniref:hypothetical protein n=1 Tax=Latilactobacillus curvatus TaxID=28038 RepID=UPI0020C7EDE3|nr:hypothetical protein [Latilactobacillus curvatus]MCP8858908.1 hypothetical protein [Latilactobacillus curvatus]
MTEVKVPRAYCIGRVKNHVIQEYSMFLYNDIILAQADCDSLNGADKKLDQVEGCWTVLEFGRPIFVRSMG